MESECVFCVCFTCEKQGCPYCPIDPVGNCEKQICVAEDYPLPQK